MPGAAAKRRLGGRGQAGYSLAMLIMLATVMSIMVAAVLPAWSKMIQRDKEEELIARGWQYAEAIRVFQNRFGRPPQMLTELITAKPRCIRHLYKDPMTGEDFAPIFNMQPVTPAPVQAQPTPTGTKQPPASGDDSGNGFDPGKPKVVPIGPIVGVHSTSTKKSSLLFYGRDHYDQWQFLVMALNHRAVGRGFSAPSSGKLELSIRWLGRPPFNLEPAGMPVQPGPGSGLGRGSGPNGPFGGGPPPSPGGRPLP